MGGSSMLPAHANADPLAPVTVDIGGEALPFGAFGSSTQVGALQAPPQADVAAAGNLVHEVQAAPGLQGPEFTELVQANGTSGTVAGLGKRARSRRQRGPEGAAVFRLTDDGTTMVLGLLDAPVGVAATAALGRRGTARR